MDKELIGYKEFATQLENKIIRKFNSINPCKENGESIRGERRSGRTTFFNYLSEKLNNSNKINCIVTDLSSINLNEFDEWERAFAANVHTSLDAAYDEFSMWFVSKDSNPEQKLSEEDLKKSLRNSLEVLSQKEALVIQLYYVEELNVYEIAEILSVTTGRVSQIKKSAISRLRKSMSEIEASIVQ